jgi:menaquinone-9 beta-reductase
MTTHPDQVERFDVVVVGCRPAGSAAAATYARAGRRVLAIDRAHFPSDTLSTHVLFAGGVAELERLGALDRVLASGAPKLPILELGGEEHVMYGRYSPVDGINYGLCARRPALDHALVRTARSAGAEVRERCSLTGLVWRGGRVVGIRYTDADRVVHEVHAGLVVGADGRDSTVARLVGVEEPYRRTPPGRGLAFHYVADPVAVASGDEELRNKISAWRVGRENGYFFPTDRDGGLALFMPPVADIARFRKDPRGVWAEKLAGQPRLRERLQGTEIEGRLRHADDTDGYFRVSSGPGWALVGDAGHFKDPAIAQGIRDALHYGRVLAQMTAPVLDRPAELDRQLRAYERVRDRGVLPCFYWGMKHTRAEPVTPIELEFFREAAGNPRLATDVADTFSRIRTPQQSISLRRRLRWTWRALRRPGRDVRAVVRAAVTDLALDVRMYRDLVEVRCGGRPYDGVRITRVVEPAPLPDTPPLSVPEPVPAPVTAA